MSGTPAHPTGEHLAPQRVAASAAADEPARVTFPIILDFAPTTDGMPESEADSETYR
ncbi:MAG: hypothetical protein IT376_14810 [Polyangiaceae bacterium]|nr:hypothetical protein [Polyangiaceae bacterium]